MMRIEVLLIITPTKRTVRMREMNDVMTQAHEQRDGKVDTHWESKKRKKIQSTLKAGVIRNWMFWFVQPLSYQQGLLSTEETAIHTD